MKKIITLIILAAFLFTNTAYSMDTLRPPIDKVKKRTRNAANEAVYRKVARWINENIGNKGDIEKIVSELKDGKLVFEYRFESSEDELGYEFKADFVRGFYSTYDLKKQRLYQGYDMDIYKRTMLRIPEDISKLASKILRKSQMLISEYEMDYLNQNNVNLLSSIGEAWELRIKLDEKITERIVSCLRSLGKDSLASALSKKIITKKLLKLQKRIPKTIPIIREKSLELVEIDRENFREGLKPFIIDYIALRDAIRRAGLKDDTRDFYNLFDEIVAWKQTGQHEKEFLASTEFIEKIPEGYDNFTVSEVPSRERKRKALGFVDYDMWVKCYNFKELYGGFIVECEYTPAGTLSEYDWGATLSAGLRYKKPEDQGRLSVYPQPIATNKKTGYSVKTTKDKKIKCPESAVIKIYPKINPTKPLREKHKDIKKTRSYI